MSVVMFRKALLIAIIATGIGFTYGGDNPESTNPQPEISTTLPPVTTALPNTTTSAITTSTASTTTTKTTPNTTTPATTITTSAAPNTTTSTPTPTTTAPPSPEPKSHVGNWNVTDTSTNETCIMIHMAIMLNVTYMNKQNKTSFATMYVPVNSTASGACGNEIENINLKWGTNESNNINLQFKMNATEKHFRLSNIDANIVPTETYFPDIQDKSDIMLHTGESHFTTAVNKSYLCVKEQTIELMKEDSNKTEAKMTFSHVQLQAFHSKNDTKFGDAQDCESSSTPDIVPIAVGCALVGLVAVVLIAYLVGRRRSQARGYLSM